MFTSSDIKSLQEAYQAVYDDELRSEIVEEDNIEFSNEELEDIVEEIVLELIYEGYDDQEIEESFDDKLIEEIIFEAKVTYGKDTESPEERRARAKAKVDERKSAARKAAVKGAVKKAAGVVGGAASEMGRISSNVMTRAKAGATRAAMAATGVKATDVPTKSGKVRKSADTFVAGRKADRDSVKQAIKQKIKSKAGEVASKAKAKAAGAAVDVAMAGSAAKRKGKETASAAKSAAKGAVSSAKGAVKSAASSAKSGLKRLIRRGAERVQRGAEGVARRMSEEVETFDVVLDFLLSEGIVETLEDAQWVMVNELDSEDIDAILEAYGEPMTKRQEYLTKEVERMNKQKPGSAHKHTPGKQNPGGALDRANKSAMQMRGL